MKISVVSNIDSVVAAMKQAASQVPFAMSVALNNSAETARLAVRAEMPRVFHNPTPWVLNSLRVKRSTKTNLTAEVAFKDKPGSGGTRSIMEPHVFTGGRHFKVVEAQLMRMGALPSGWNVVPGAAANLDANGNMSQGQVKQALNALSNIGATRAKLAKGSAKKNVYGLAYFVNPVGGAGRNKTLQPGVYQRISTGFGSSLKPILIFVKRASYKQRLDFFGLAEKVIAREFPQEFDKAFAQALATARS